MIILDTNVVSELTRKRPQPEVLAWWNSQTDDDLFVTAITEAELRYGVAIMPAGRRHDGLAQSIETMLGTLFPAAPCPSTAQPPANMPAYGLDAAQSDVRLPLPIVRLRRLPVPMARQ